MVLEAATQIKSCLQLVRGTTGNASKRSPITAGQA